MIKFFLKVTVAHFANFEPNAAKTAKKSENVAYISDITWLGFSFSKKVKFVIPYCMYMLQCDPLKNAYSFKGKVQLKDPS